MSVAACGSSGASTGAATGATNGAFAAKALQFAKCMRASGVPNFPDPSSQGGIDLGSGLNPQSPAFQAAQAKCKKYLPGKLGRPGKPSRAEVQAALKFATCMRSHGVPNFPDPVTSAPSGTGPILSLNGMMFAVTPSSNPKSPAFRQAASDCGLKQPRGGPQRSDGGP